MEVRRIPFDDYSDNIFSPKQILPSRMPEFLAQVTVTPYDYDKCAAMDGKLGPKQVGFNIVGLPEFTGWYPVADPIFDSVREMKVGDLIIVRDLQQCGTGHAFCYMPYREDVFVGLWNRNNVLTMTNDNEIRILMYKYLNPEDKGTPATVTDAMSGNGAIGEVTMRATEDNFTITLRAGKVTVALNSKDNKVDINASTMTTVTGPLTVTGDITAKANVTVTKDVTSTGGDVTAGAISLKTHVHNCALPVNSETQTATGPTQAPQ